ncbi:hypothetical protein [Methanobrevibacter arboriphilus]|uniref:Uncharacterized protein n=2 Tax=Methanobrevibacter arboriphilus TaxID=39441 RepID=A0ACA8R562_METAZ|nr:hypothetical protein [Methanobrevibacter arboriphilus]BBL62447.1 hypothetical protein MarbSA_14870 [Methanobrevibacter arboriphilus]
MNIVKSGFVNGKQRYSIINDGDIIKSSYDKHKLQDYLNPPIEPVCEEITEETQILDLDNIEDDTLITYKGTVNNGIKRIDEFKIIKNTSDVLEVYLPKDEKLSIFPVGDLHIGSPQFNKEWLDYWFDIIAKCKNYVVVYLMGDIFEVASKKVGDSSFRQKYDVNDQEHIFKKKVNNLKKRLGYNPFRASVSGNHDKRLLELDYSLNRSMSEDLDILKYGHKIYDTIIVNGKTLKIHLYHGKHTNKEQHLRQGAFIRDTNKKSADLFLEGHNHDTDVFSTYITGDGVNYRRFFGFTGSALDYKDGYADEKDLIEIPKGFIEYEIYPNGGLNGKEYHSDLIDWEK